MKKHILLFVFWLAFINVNSQVIVKRDFNSSGYHSSILTNEFTVLDINFDKKLLAFKHVYELRTSWNELGEIYQQACDCKYAGMENRPKSGIVLGVYDLESQSYLKSFIIYNAAYSKEDCSTYEMSVKMLDSAKQFFIEQGLDISIKPQPIALEIKGDKVKSFIFENMQFKYSNDWETDWDNNTMITSSNLWIVTGEEELIHQINQDDRYIMASGGRIDYKYAFRDEDEFVFLNLFYHTSGLAGFTDCEVYHFSPVFEFEDIK